MTPTRYRYAREGARRRVVVIAAAVLAVEICIGLAVALLAGRL